MIAIQNAHAFGPSSTVARMKDEPSSTWPTLSRLWYQYVRRMYRRPQERPRSSETSHRFDAPKITLLKLAPQTEVPCGSTALDLFLAAATFVDCAVSSAESL